MNRRIFSFILCIVMLVASVPLWVGANEVTFYQIQIDAGNGAKIEKAIIDGDEIYIASSSFSKYTRFQYHDENQTFIVKGQEFDKAFKRVTVDDQSKTVTVDAKQIDLTNCFVVDGVVYLPFCQMLPILNADIIDVNAGIIYVVNTELSMAELFYDFDIDDYWFDVNKEFFGDIEKANDYIFWSYILDSIKGRRFDRVFAFNSGLSEDYQAILTDYLKDNEVYHEAMSTEDHAGNLLESITGLNETTEPLHNVYEWFESVDELEPTDKLIQYLQKSNASDNFGDDLYPWVEAAHGEYIEIGNDLKAEFSFADVMEGIDWVYSFANHIEDHRHMIDAVYGISDYEENLIPGASSPLGEVNPEFLAAKKIYQTYSDDIIPAVGKKCAEAIVLNIAENAFESTTVGFYASAFSLIVEVVDLYLPGDFGERALLMHHANIMNAAYHAATPVLDTEKSTNDYRLSLLLMLMASRACYKTMAENAAGYEQYKDYYQEQIDKIEDMMMGLYLVAGNAGFDTYQNFSKFAEQNKNAIKNACVIENAITYPDIDESTYLEFLNKHPEYNYYALLDLNADGVIEMLATERVYTNYTSWNSGVDLYVWKNGSISLAYEDIDSLTPLAFDVTNEWLVRGTGGAGIHGTAYIHLNEELDIWEEIVEYSVEHNNAGDVEVVHIYYNGIDVAEEECEGYAVLCEKHQLGRPEDIIFQVIPKTSPTAGDNYRHIIPLKTETCYDLDGDGIYERISIIEQDCNAILSINGMSYELDAYWANPTEYYTILNIDASNNTLLIGISDYGTSDDSVSFLYAYDQGQITFVGSFDDLIGQNEWSAQCNGDGTISATTRMNDLGTWLAKVKYAVDDHSVKDITEFYDFADFYEYEIGWEVISKCDLVFYDEVNVSSSQVVIPAGTVLYMTGCKRPDNNKTWAAFESDVFDDTLWLPVDTSGWPRSVETPQGNVASTDAFDGFYYAG